MVFEIRVCTFRKVNKNLENQIFLKVAQFRYISFYGMIHKMSIMSTQRLWFLLVQGSILGLHANKKPLYAFVSILSIVIFNFKQGWYCWWSIWFLSPFQGHISVLLLLTTLKYIFLGWGVPSFCFSAFAHTTHFYWSVLPDLSELTHICPSRLSSDVTISKKLSRSFILAIVPSTEL